HGACPTCRGVGTTTRFAEELLVPDPSLSIRGGAIAALAADEDEAVAKPTAADLAPLAERFGFSLDTPWKDLPARARKIVLHGAGAEKVEMRWRQVYLRRLLGKDAEHGFPGLVPILEKLYRAGWYPTIGRFVTETTCETCGGARLRPEALR